MLRPFALLFGLLLSAALSAAPKWYTLQAPHCLIVSQLSERETRAWATEFEQFTATLRQKILVEEAFLPPLTVVLFSDSGQFAPYCPLDAKGKKRDIAGVFSSRETWGVIGLAESFSSESTRRVVLHEATHWLLSATRTEMPLWLNEGFAEVFSTFQAKKTHGLLGDPIPYHVSTLRGKSWISLLQLMNTGPGDRLYTDSRLNDVFYAESWIFAHRLLFEDPKKGHDILNGFFAARLRGTGQLEALQGAFGQNVDTIQDDLESYIRNGRFTFSKLPFPDHAPIAAAFTPAAPAAVEDALARLAVGTGRIEKARVHIAKAAALDAADPAPHELLALLAASEQRLDEAGAEAARALELRSTDAWMHYLTAQALWKRHYEGGSLNTAAREIADHFARAIELQPKLRLAYTAYASLAPMLPSVTQADASILAAGYKTYPDAVELLVGLAAVLHKGHNAAEATQILDLALSRGTLLTQQQRTDAEDLRTRWQIEPHLKKLDEHFKAGAYREALAELDMILTIPMRYDLRRPHEQRRGSLLILATIAAAQEADREGRAAESVRLLDELLASPEISQRERNQLEAARAKFEQRAKIDVGRNHLQRINELSGQGRFTEAAAEYDVWLQEPLDTGKRLWMENARDHLRLMAEVDAAREALEAGRTDEAATRLDAIRSNHFLDEGMSEMVDELDRKTRRRKARSTQ